MRYIIIVLLLIFAGFLFLFRDLIFGIAARLPEIQNITFDIEASDIKKEVIAPAPIRAKTESTQSFLTDEGVIRLTNIRRRENGLAPLMLNAELVQAAAAKVQDMFNSQYFAHRSPQGLDAGAFAENNGYEYIMIGENLALGNFRSDAELVQGWMDSPGHRANILNPDFLEIGVAVRQGTFEGRSTWLAVQEFGTPRSACPIPAGSASKNIEAAKAALSRLETDLANLKKAIDAKTKEYKQHPSEETQAEIQALADEYNRQVAIYNAKQTQLQKDITAYNSQIKAANTCITTYTS